jgi:hypothetical protein
MQIVHDSSGKKKPMQVVDDGKETKLKTFKGATVPEQDTQENAEVEEVIDDTQAVHEEQTTESTPTQTEAESEEQEEAEDSVEKPQKRNASYQNRINELVKRANEAERQRNDYYNRNQQLETDLKKKNVVTEDYAKLQSQFYDSRKANAERALESARVSHKSAHEEGDSDKMLKAAEDIAEVKYELKQLENKQPFVPPTPKQSSNAGQTQATAPQQPQSQPDPRALRWAQDNSWFGTNVAKTGAAYAIDAALKMEGYNPSSEEYYSELDKRVVEAFPQETSRPRQTVAGVSKTSSSSKKVRMNQSQIAMARKLGVPIEEYAKFVRTE